MGLLSKQYLRYVNGPQFGVIGTGRSICFVTRFNNQENFIAVSACENVIIWDIRRKLKILTLNCDIHGTITSIESRPPSRRTTENTHIAVGYSNGVISLFDTRVGQAIKFNGHKSGISSIAWDNEGMRIVSGSEDGEIVVWDVVSERGIVRLLGHKGRINRVRFLSKQNIIVSASKDNSIKFWDLDTNHCFKTFTPYQTETLDFAIVKDDTRLITGINNKGLHVWKLHFKQRFQSNDTENNPDDETKEPGNKMFVIDDEGERKFKVIDGHDEAEDESVYLEITEMGKIVRSKDDRICGLITDGRTVACFGKSSIVDMYIILNDDEIVAKKEKRLKKLRKRAREKDQDENGVILDEIELSYEIRKIPAFKALNKVNGIALFTSKEGTIKAVTLHMDNSLAMYSTSVSAKQDKKLNADSLQACLQVSSIGRPGHRLEVRCVAFNSVGDQIVTASGDSIRVWNRLKCDVIMSLESDYALSLILAPGDRHALIGTKSGTIQLFDIASGQLLENVQAHEKNENDGDSGIWGLSLTSDGRGFVSGGSDCLVKFWSFELVEDTITGKGKRLSFVQDSRALKVADPITCIRCSNHNKFLAVSTLDLKETIYFMDSLKLVHELYGKSLPSMCMDFSSDATMLATGSVDAIVRIYGTDFGDMRKMLKNAHQGGVTDLKFIPKTHLFFTCGQDGSVKQWDGDKFQRIVTLTGHFGIVKCLAVEPKGAWVVTCGKDRTIRLWERTNEPLVLGEEREEERRRKEEEEELGVIQRPVVVGEQNSNAVRPTISSHESEKAADQLLEAICIYRQQKERGDNSAPTQLMTLVYKTDDPLKFVLLVLRKIKSSELEEALLMLPFNRVLELLVILKGIIERDWDVELACRVLIVAVRTNLTQLTLNQQASLILRALARVVPDKIQKTQDMVGYNLAGLRHMQHRFEDRNENKLFVEAALRTKDSRKRRKRKNQAIKRAILTI